METEDIQTARADAYSIADIEKRLAGASSRLSNTCAGAQNTLRRVNRILTKKADVGMRCRLSTHAETERSAMGKDISLFPSEQVELGACWEEGKAGLGVRHAAVADKTFRQLVA